MVLKVPKEFWKFSLPVEACNLERLLENNMQPTLPSRFTRVRNSSAQGSGSPPEPLNARRLDPRALDTLTCLHLGRNLTSRISQLKKKTLPK